MSSINEMNDLGDRSMTGHSYSQGGAVGSSAGGTLNTFSGPDNSQNVNQFYSNYNNTVQYDQENAWEYVKDIENIKDKVTPDEVVMGIKYEMKKQVVPDKNKAKFVVVNNLKKDPKYYSRLHMLGIDVDEKDEAIMEVLTSLKARKYSQKNGDFYK